MAHDYSVVEDAQVSSSFFSKNWESNDAMVWRMRVVEHTRAGVLPFGIVVLRGDFNGRLTVALEEE